MLLRRTSSLTQFGRKGFADGYGDYNMVTVLNCIL